MSELLETVKPLGDKILVQRLAKVEKSVGGIIFSDTAQEKNRKATVCAVGAGKLLETGERVAPSVKPGDVVYLSSYAGHEIRVGVEDYLVVTESEILAVIVEKV